MSCSCVYGHDVCEIQYPPPFVGEPAKNIQFIQSECFVQPFTNEGGCIVTETTELL